MGETPLHIAIRRERGQSLHIVDFLVQNSSNLNVATFDGHTAVHYCAIYNQPECLKLLLRSGANVSIETKDKRTTVDLAKEYGSGACEELVRCSVSHYATRVRKRVSSDPAVDSEPEIAAGEREHRLESFARRGRLHRPVRRGHDRRR